MYRSLLLAVMLFFASVIPTMAAAPDGICNTRVYRYRSLVPVPEDNNHYHIMSVTWRNDTDAACDMSFTMYTAALVYVQPLHPAPLCEPTTGAHGAKCTGQLAIGETAEVEFYTTRERMRILDGQATVTDQIADRPSFSWLYKSYSIYIPQIAR